MAELLDACGLRPHIRKSVMGWTPSPPTNLIIIMTEEQQIRKLYIEENKLREDVCKELNLSMRALGYRLKKYKIKKQNSYKFTNKQLENAVRKSTSVAQAMKLLGIKRSNGGFHSHFGKRIKKANIDTSHFTGQGHAKGKTSEKKLTWQKILVYDRCNGLREATSRLRRAMIESGIEFKCHSCNIEKWKDNPITFEIEHADGDCLNNRIENLSFLCPNCHSQTETYCNKGFI